MNAVHEPARDTPVVAEVDVLVAGGGCAGVAAALAAARGGASTMLVERYGYLGGLATGGLVILLPTDTEGAMTWETIGRLEKVGGIGKTEVPGWPIVFDPELYKWLAFEMLQEAGCRLLLNAWAVSAVAEGNMVKGAVFETKAGRRAVLAKVVVDATGDADIAHFAGAAIRSGGLDGKRLPVSTIAFVQGLDLDAFPRRGEQPDFLRKMNAHPTDPKLRPGEINLWGAYLHELDGQGVDGCDPEQVTRAEILLRKQVTEWFFELKEKAPGCGNAFLSLVAPQLGIRDTRRIVGLYNLTKEDWESGKSFDDAVAVAGKAKPIPYRSLVPAETDGMLVGGRCISADVETRIRLIPPCIETGYAAGAAAALCAEKGLQPRELPAQSLREAMEAVGK